MRSALIDSTERARLIYTTARGQADKLAEYVCAECGWRLDMLFAESIGCGPAVFLKSSPKVQVDHMILSGPEYLDFGIMNKPLLKIMPQNQYKTAHEKSMPAWVLKLMGQTERGNADHDELYSGQYQPGVSPRHMEAGLYLYRSDFPCSRTQTLPAGTEKKRVI